MVRTFLTYSSLSFFLFFTALHAASPGLITTPYGIVDADVSYSSLQRNSMDLYIPHQLDFTSIAMNESEFSAVDSNVVRKKYPVILFIHGGSFVAGDRKEYPYAGIGEAFQRQGIICAVMSYRLMRDSVWPAQPRDVARAFAWLRQHASEYGGDPDRIYIIGHSAGGHLAALVSTDSTYMNETGSSLHDIAGTVSIGAMMSDGGSVAGLTQSEEQQLFHSDWFFKIFGSKKNFINSLPISHVNGDMPRMLLLLADSERNDPPKERTVIDFISRSSEYRVPVKYYVLQNRTHMGTVEHMTDPSDAAVQMIMSFISEK